MTNLLNGNSLLGDPLTVTVSSQPKQLCPPLGDQVMIYNNDLLNVAYAGYQSSITVFNAQPIQPLTYIVLSGRRQIYGFSPSGASLTITPGGTYASPSPAQVAAQIALTGLSSAVPTQIQPPTLMATVGNTFSQTYTFTTGASYELVATPNTPANACWADIQVDHLDASNNIIYTDYYSIGCGALGNFSPVIIRGNLQARSIKISGTVATGAQINALPITTGPFTGTGLNLAVYSQPFALNPAAPKVVPSNTTSGVLAGFQAVSVPASGNSAFVPAFSYQGRVKWHLFGATAANIRSLIQLFRVTQGSTVQGSLRLQNDGSVAVWQEISMPGYLAVYSMSNNTAGAITVTSSLTAVDYI